MDKRRYLLFGWAVLLCLVSTAMSLCMGAARLSPLQLWQAVTGHGGGVERVIFWYTRLPRTAACLLAGSALAVSGCVIQRVLHNHLASPGIIGVNAGAGLAVNLCCAFGLLSGWAIAGCAFAGAVTAVVLVVTSMRSKKGGGAPAALGLAYFREER